MNPVHPDLAPLAGLAKLFCGSRRRMDKDESCQLAAALRSAVGERTGWLRPEHRIGDPAHYQRHLLYADPDDDFTIAALCWLPGQQSAVHGHHVWCVYGVVAGELVEESFHAPETVLEPLASKVIRAGETAEIDLGGPLYHRVSNRSAAPLVTLHVYGVAAGRLTTGVNRLYA